MEGGSAMGQPEAESLLNDLVWGKQKCVISPTMFLKKYDALLFKQNDIIGDDKKRKVALEFLRLNKKLKPVSEKEPEKEKEIKEKEPENEKEIKEKEPEKEKEIKEKENDKTEKLEFCVSLSREEIEEDFKVIFGRIPTRRPKNKRSKKVQKQLDTLVPGLCLSEMKITADTYKVKGPP